MNKRLTQKDKDYVWHPYSPLIGADNIVVESAQGIYLYTEDGRKIIDAISSWWVNLHGHSNTYLVQKLAEQAAKMEHIIFAGFTHEVGIRLAERLLEILPGEQKKIFFSDNGSTAVEIALKMAIQYKINKGERVGKIIAFEGAFHGDTFGAMSVSGRGLFSKSFSNYLFDVEYIPFPEKGSENEVINTFEQLIENNICSAFIYEPLIQGAAGMRIYSADILEKLLHIAKRHKIVCIADEVMTGFGRTGKLFASDYIPIKPDIICLSKGITGGFMPFGATSCNSEVEKAFLSEKKENILYHGHSYTGNPMACALANASLDLLLTKECQQKITAITQSHIAFLDKIKDIRAVKKAEVLGTILSIEISTNEESGYLNKVRDELYNFFLSRDILIRPLGNIIYIIPPYIIEDNELNFLYNSIEDLLKLKSTN